MTYVIIRPVMTVIGIVCTLTNVYGDGEWRFNRFYPYSTLFNGIAQFWALYCLVLMYQVRLSCSRGVTVSPAKHPPVRGFSALVPESGLARR